MKAFEELVEEVYQDGDLRPEFVKFVQLRRKRRESSRPLQEQKHSLSSRPQFLSYYEISQTSSDLSRETTSLQWGMMILSSSLFRTLSLRYPLPAADVHRLREAVVIRYEQMIG